MLETCSPGLNRPRLESSLIFVIIVNARLWPDQANNGAGADAGECCSPDIANWQQLTEM
jgi:hypothetical protein